MTGPRAPPGRNRATPQGGPEVRTRTTGGGAPGGGGQAEGGGTYRWRLATGGGFLPEDGVRDVCGVDMWYSYGWVVDRCSTVRFS